LKNTITIGVCCFLVSCSVREKDSSVVLARVNDRVLTVKNLEKTLSPENRKQDHIKNFIHTWVDNALYYDAALGDGLLNDGRLLNERDRYYKQIVIGSYVQTKMSASVAVSNSEIREYYDENSHEFIRQNDDAYVNHFFTDKHSDARSVRSWLLSGQGVDPANEPFEGFGVEKKTVTRGLLLEELDIAIFKNKEGSIVGPIRTANGYHVFEIVKRYKKGSQVGLEDVYDKIYQRLLKQKQLVLATDLLDSLKEKSTVFINSNYQ